MSLFNIITLLITLPFVNIKSVGSEPTATPTLAPSVAPTLAPSLAPSVAPSVAPTITPSLAPSVAPSSPPSVAPTLAPSLTPSVAPTLIPSSAPTIDCTQDTTDPYIICPPDQTLDINTPLPPLTASCSDSQYLATLTFIGYNWQGNSFSPLNCSSGLLWIETRLWQCIDECGNEATCSESLGRTDVIDPTISCPATVTIELPLFDPSLQLNPQETGYANCNDNYGIVSKTSSDSSINGCGDTYTITRTWTCRDPCNTVTCDQTIAIVDTMNPIITCPPNMIIQSGVDDTTSAATGIATCGDAASHPEGVSITESDSTVYGCPTSENPLTTSVITRTWNCTDACGLTDSCIQTLTIIDTLSPVITCPSDVFMEMPIDLDPNGADVGEATCNDLADPDPEITWMDFELPTTNTTNEAPYCAAIPIISRQWTCRDRCGGTTMCEQSIIRTDSQDPDITCPAITYLEAIADTSPTGAGNAICVDGHMVDSVDYTDIVTPGECTNIETIVRTWTCDDFCGHSSACNQQIIVQDTTDPVITCPSDTTIGPTDSVDPSNTGMTSCTDTASDIVSGFNDQKIDVECNSIIRRTWSCEDCSLNIATCTQTITILNSLPEMACPENVVVNVNADLSSSSLGEATCDFTLSESDTETGMDPCPKIITRTFNCTDATCSVTNTCDQNIEVICPTAAPSLAPSFTPTFAPSLTPSGTPSFAPSKAPSFAPSGTPSYAPSATPTLAPSATPTLTPSYAPSATPTLAPSATTTLTPSIVPSVPPSSAPLIAPSSAPTNTPTFIPTDGPTPCKCDCDVIPNDYYEWVSRYRYESKEGDSYDTSNDFQENNNFHTNDNERNSNENNIQSNKNSESESDDSKSDDGESNDNVQWFKHAEDGNNYSTKYNDEGLNIIFKYNLNLFEAIAVIIFFVGCICICTIYARKEGILATSNENVIE